MSVDRVVSRRQIMQWGGLATLSGFAPRTLAPGVQLYTVRSQVEKDARATLRAIAGMGYREVEVLRNQVTTLMPLLQQVNLAPVSLHFETPLLTGNWDAWKHADMPPIEAGVTYEGCVALARDHGFLYLVFNYLSPEERLGLDFYRRLADKLNAAALQARKAGLQFCYHNHDFEFEPKLGGRPIDVLLERMDRELIRLEVDAFWVSMAGVNAAEFIRKHGDWVEMVHLKDRAPGTPVHYDIATVPDASFRELGAGDLPLRDILNTTLQTGAKHLFVEQDFSKDPLASLQQSYTFLKRNGFVQ